VNVDFWLEHIAAIHTGVELAGNDLAESDRHLAFAQIAAFGNNRGLLIGDRIPTRRCRWPLRVSTAIDGETVGSVVAASPWDIVTAALGEAASEAKALDMVLDAGNWIATGALTGIHPVACDQNAIVQFEGYESIEMITSDICKWQEG
jgi:2-keto-4-pentenoate hydratase